MNLTEDNLHLLPSSMQSLAQTIGTPAVLALIRTHGGLEDVYVPIKVTPDHYLMRLIGVEAFTKLVAEYAGDMIDIPRCKRATQEAVYQQIKRESLDTTHENLARKYGYTLRHIRNIVDGVVDDRQQEMF